MEASLKTNLLLSLEKKSFTREKIWILFQFSVPSLFVTANYGLLSICIMLSCSSTETIKPKLKLVILF